MHDVPSDVVGTDVQSFGTRVPTAVRITASRNGETLRQLQPVLHQ